MHLLQVFFACLAAFLLVAPRTAHLPALVPPSDALPLCDVTPAQFRVANGFFLSPDFLHDQIAFATAVYPEDIGWRFYRSDDGGRTWRLSLNEGISTVGFAPDYAHNQTIYGIPVYGSATAPYIWRSDDRGQTWQRLTMPADGPGIGGFSALAVAGPDILYYGRGYAPGPYSDPKLRGLFRFAFSEAVTTWEQLTFKNVNDVTLSPDFAQDQTLFIGEYGYKINDGLKKSTNGGRTWQSSDEGINLSVHLDGSGTTMASFAPDYPADPLLFAVTDSRYYRSTDGGVSWHASYSLPYWLTDIDPADPPDWILSPYFTHDRRAWIEYGKLMTSDAGLTWRRASSIAMPNLVAREWCEDDRCGVLLLGGQEYGEGRVGIYKSFDLGRTWHCPAEPSPTWWPNIPPVFSTFASLIAK